MYTETHDPNRETVTEQVLEEAPFQYRLAGRGARWGAAFIDGIIRTLAMLPDLISVNSNPDSSLGAILLPVGLLIYLIVQAVLLVRDGQSIGKRIVGTRIVRYASGDHPDWVKLLVLRGLLTGLLSLIPGFALIDALFIFREDKRCLHDRMADTMVVNA